MAGRRMFSKELVVSDSFMSLPAESRCLWMYLNMNADDDGFVGNLASLTRGAGCTAEDVTALIGGGYLINFGSGVAAITHWNMCNRLRESRHTPTVYQAQLSRLTVDGVGIYHLSEEPVTEEKTQEISVSKGNTEEASTVKVSEGEESAPPARTFGSYANVTLTEEEIASLKADVPEWKRYAERLSEYMAESGRSYHNHSAVIRRWYREDKQKQREKERTDEGRSSPSPRAYSSSTRSYDMDAFTESVFGNKLVYTPRDVPAEAS